MDVTERLSTVERMYDGQQRVNNCSVKSFVKVGMFKMLSFFVNVEMNLVESKYYDATDNTEYTQINPLWQLFNGTISDLVIFFSLFLLSTQF